MLKHIIWIFCIYFINGYLRTIFFASSYILGFLSYNPLISEAKINKSQLIIEASKAANVSLSPTLISSTASDKYDGIYGIRAQSKSTKDTTGRIEIREDNEYNVGNGRGYCKAKCICFCG